MRPEIPLGLTDEEWLMVLEQRGSQALTALELVEQPDDQVRYACEVLRGQWDEALFSD